MARPRGTVKDPEEKFLSKSIRVPPALWAEEVLVEFLNALSGGRWLRRAAAEHVPRLRAMPHVEVISQTPGSFASGFALYEQRPDKRYSLVDCISFEVMRERGISEALTHDRHFEQDGFTALLRHP
jgi:predicted nucleic acid-binding protein